MVRSLLAWILLVSSVSAQDLAVTAKNILFQHCVECHGIKREGDKNYDVRNFNYLINHNYIVPNSPKQSKIFQRVTTNPVEMPPETRPPLNKTEIETLRNWIQRGAISWEPQIKQEIITERYVTTAIGTDLNHNRGMEKYFRYLTISNLYNEGVRGKDLENVHEAVSKVMNFLAREKEICKPTTLLDELGLVIRIDLRDYGWKAKDWNLVSAEYPFGDGTNYMRADWFVMNVSQPPLYYQLRRIPETEKEFEKQLRIKRDAPVHLAGITDSQVSIHNRLFRRYELEDGGYYWKTSNIKDDNDSSVLDLKNFDSDYSVSLFTLKNHLLGFAVFEKDEAKNHDKIFHREDKIDVDAEFDPNKVSGDPHPVPMISCIVCHTTGIRTDVHDVTHGKAVDFLELDKKDFMKSAIPVSNTMEPVKSVADRYNRPVDLDCASRDKGMTQTELHGLIQKRPDLFQLRPLLDGKTVTRKLWQDLNAFRVTKQKEK